MSIFFFFFGWGVGGGRGLGGCIHLEHYRLHLTKQYQFLVLAMDDISALCDFVGFVHR